MPLIQAALSHCAAGRSAQSSFVIAGTMVVFASHESVPWLISVLDSHAETEEGAEGATLAMRTWQACVTGANAARWRMGGRGGSFTAQSTVRWAMWAKAAALAGRAV